MPVMAILFLTGCTKTEMVIPNTTINAVVNPSDWQYDNTTNTYYVNISMPEIIDQTNSTDGIVVSVSFGNDVYELVPSIYNGYSFYVSHKPGILTIEAENQFATTTAPGSAMQVKVVIVPSN